MEEISVVHKIISERMKTYVEAIKEFYEKYYKKMHEFAGVKGIIKKARNYNEINYSKAYSLIEKYKNIKKL